ncbi:hypothetical protein LSTR_LSTR006172 [Laodelphax striatellus]|uniref:Uncharacterized protein n=1 Tax=Laodelphax striatellus TaxID=195883 RepID=A0A482XPY5_LAOST|nr:hypothetical protein LSTR_LSTR006172 [Laodelphax striatellus]
MVCGYDGQKWVSAVPRCFVLLSLFRAERSLEWQTVAAVAACVGDWHSGAESQRDAGAIRSTLCHRVINRREQRRRGRGGAKKAREEKCPLMIIRVRRRFVECGAARPGSQWQGRACAASTNQRGAVDRRWGAFGRFLFIIRVRAQTERRCVSVRMSFADEMRTAQ